MLDVCLLGTGGMMPLPYRKLTSLMMRYNGSSILIDCGEGTQVAIKEKGWGFKSIDIICFTHFHADHISGLPGLLLTMGNTEREEPLKIMGPRGIEQVVNALRIIAPELPFPIEFIEITGQTGEYVFNGFRIEAFRACHNVSCYGYNMIIPRVGKFIPEKARENNVPISCWNRLQKGELVEEDGILYTPDMILGEERKGIKLTYCTDSRPTQLIADSAVGSDLFICEGMYGEENMEQKAQEHNHMTFDEAASLGKYANPDEMWLTHYSPSLVRPDEFIGRVRKIFPRLTAGKDLMSKEINFKEE